MNIPILPAKAVHQTSLKTTVVTTGVALDMFKTCHGTWIPDARQNDVICIINPKLTLTPPHHYPSVCLYLYVYLNVDNANVNHASKQFWDSGTV